MNLQQGGNVLAGIGDLGRGLWQWLQPNASVIDSFGDFVFFQFVIHRLQHDIQMFGERVLGRVMAVVAVVALTLLTIWILVQGYRLLTGQLRESAMGLVVNAAKATFIVAMALSFGMAGDPMTEFLTFDMKNGIHELITGNAGSPEDEIDSNLGWMQVAMASVDVLESGGSLDNAAEKERAQTWIGLGTAGPAITAGALMLMYQVAMALFIGLGPIFILCLLFDSTKSLFQKWLMYGIGTMFSLAVLSAMVTIALRMVTDVAEGMWAADALNTLVPGLGGGGVVSFSSRAMQTGSMGLILTLLLITVPPMVSNFFGGTLGSFMHYTAFGVAAAAPGPHGPAGSYNPGAYHPPQPEGSVSRADTGRDRSGDFRTAQAAPYQAGSLGGQPVDSEVRQGTRMPGREASSDFGYSPSGSAYSSQGLSSTQPQPNIYVPAPPEKDPTPRGGRQGS